MWTEIIVAQFELIQKLKKSSLKIVNILVKI
jgi:hypothetical protein